MIIPQVYVITLKGVDVTSRCLTGTWTRNNQPIKSGRFIFTKKINDDLIIDNTIVGKSFSVERGFDSDLVYKFRGEVVNFEESGSTIVLEVADKLYVAQRRQRDYTYEKNIDLSNGVASEIFKNLCDYIGLGYTSDSVPSTGSDFSLITYPAKGYVIESMSDLARIFQRRIFYRDSDDLVYFVPEGFEATSTVLTVGSNVVNAVRWNNQGESIINNLTVVGANEMGWVQEDFTPGAGVTTITLTAKPVDTEVYVGGVIARRGVNSSDPKDYYVVQDEKQIVFTVAPNPSTVNVYYSTPVPVKILTSDGPSISDYEQRDATISNTRLRTTDDAEIAALSYLSENSDVLTSAPLSVVSDNGLEVGQQVRVIDFKNNKDLSVVIQSIEYFYPYKPDRVLIGKPRLSDADIQLKILENVRRLERELANETDIDVILSNAEKTVEVFGYVKRERAVPTAGVLYWDSPVQGDWDDFDWGNDSEENYTTWSLATINNTVFEDFLTTEFKHPNPAHTTATWVGNGRVDFLDSQTARGGNYVLAGLGYVKKITLSAVYDGQISFEVSVDNSVWYSINNDSFINITTFQIGHVFYWRCSAAVPSTLYSVKIRWFYG
jgi:hypothetical protein